MMFTSFTTILAGAALVSAVPTRRGQSVSVTPHEQYSSSIGVPGCKINTNRVAYWPGTPDCNNLCVKLTKDDRSLHVLNIDTSAGAHDISYDAWNYLAFGASATSDPQEGGGVEMQYEFVDNSECSDLLDDGKLPLSAANSMNYVASCLAEPDSWVAKNHVLLNIADPTCSYGVDEECSLDLNVSNQPSCPSGLGVQTPTGDDLKVINIGYGTGEKVVAR